MWTHGFSFPRAIETDIPAEEGTVGGLLANTRGDMVGLLAFAYTPVPVKRNPGGGMSPTEELGKTQSKSRPPVVMAIPADLLRKICTALRRSGRVRRGALGAEFVFRRDALVQVEPHHEIPGAKVRQVRAGGAAERAGLKVGDIVVMVEGRHIRTQDDLIWFAEKVEYGDIGSSLAVKINRCIDGCNYQVKTLNIKIGEREETLQCEFSSH